jgi:hypothetical protein
VFDGDAEVSAGVAMAPGVWKAPEEITPEMLGASRQYVREHECLCDPPEPAVPWEWIGRLCAGIPHNMAARVLEMRIEALVEAVEDFPAFVWTKATRKRAAAQFAYIPAAKELVDFAETIAAEERERIRRMMAILDRGSQASAPRPAPHRTPVWSKELAEEALVRSREKSRRELEELGRIMRERDAQAALEKPAGTVAEQIQRTAKAMKAMKPAPAEAAE